MSEVKGRRESVKHLEREVYSAREVQREEVYRAEADARQRLIDRFGDAELPTGEQMAVLRASLALTGREVSRAVEDGDMNAVRKLGGDLVELGTLLEEWELRSKIAEPEHSDMHQLAEELLTEARAEKEKLIVGLRKDLDKGSAEADEARECLRLLGESVEDALQSGNFLLAEEYSASAADVWMQARGLEEASGVEVDDEELREEAGETLKFVVGRRHLDIRDRAALLAEAVRIMKKNPSIDLQGHFEARVDELLDRSFTRKVVNTLHPR